MLRPVDESIRQAPPPKLRRLGRLFARSAENSAPAFSTTSLVLFPDWCNSGVAVRIILGWNLIGIAVVLAFSTDSGLFVANGLRLALTLEPTLIASLLVACLCRPLLLMVSELVQIMAVLAIPALLIAAYEVALGPLLALDRNLLSRDALLAAVAGGATLYWARLRSQSHLPALAEARLAALQSRIRPHFLFNSLNAVLGLIRTDARRAETMLEDLADLFRVLMRDHHERVPLAEEIALCRKYLDIESLRLGERLQLDIHVDPRADDALVPLLLLQPLVENAVLHGIEPSSEPGLVSVRVDRKGNQVVIVIANPWHGATQRIGHQVGLANVRQRLELLHDLEARLDTHIEDQRFVLHMSLPYLSRAPVTR